MSIIIFIVAFILGAVVGVILMGLMAMASKCTELEEDELYGE